MPLTNNTSHLNHEAVTKHTWSPNNDTTRYEASGSTTYKPDLFQHGEAADTPHISEYTYSNGDPKVRLLGAHHMQPAVFSHGVDRGGRAVIKYA
jgi:hypothetical protein